MALEWTLQLGTQSIAKGFLASLVHITEEKKEKIAY